MYFTSTLNRGGQLYAPATLTKNIAQYTLWDSLCLRAGQDACRRESDTYRRSSFP